MGHIHRRDEIGKKEGENDQQVDHLVRVNQVLEGLACRRGLRLAALEGGREGGVVGSSSVGELKGKDVRPTVWSSLMRRPSQ